MPVLIVQLSVFLVLTLIAKFKWQTTLTLGRRGRMAMAAMFIFTGVFHFILTEGMVEMVPPQFPEPLLIVYISGVLEIMGGIGLLIGRLYKLTTWALILFLLAVLPSNIYSAINHTGLGGHVHGPVYLWFRIPLQLFWIGWLGYFMKKP